METGAPAYGKRASVPNLPPSAELTKWLVRDLIFRYSLRTYRVPDASILHLLVPASAVRWPASIAW
ncbi:hypothetical protein GCM10009080_57440 [Cupriavidus pauculus]